MSEVKDTAPNKTTVFPTPPSFDFKGPLRVPIKSNYVESQGN